MLECLNCDSKKFEKISNATIRILVDQNGLELSQEVEDHKIYSIECANCGTVAIG